MLFSVFIAMLLGLASPSHTHTKTSNNCTTVTTYDDDGDDGEDGDDTGGETSHFPPKNP